MSDSMKDLSNRAHQGSKAFAYSKSQDSFGEQSVKRKWPSGISTTGNLCSFCNSLNYDALGFRAWDPNDKPTRVGRKRPSILNNNLYVLRGMVDVMSTAQNCYICRQFGEMLAEYKSDERLNGTETNPENLLAKYMLTAVFASFPAVDEGCGGTFERLYLGIVSKMRQGFGQYSNDPLIERIFQKCHSRIADLNDFCTPDSLTNWNVSGAHPFDPRIRPLVANIKLFMKWKETCHVRHDDKCRGDVVPTGSAVLRFVDVETRNVVDGQKGDKYFALSYLWGSNGNPCQLNRSTASSIYRSGQLTSDVLPATIEDAIIVTAALGGKYLWVDCLCIFQDDDADKAEILPQMHLIYSNAEVTIVAVAGEDCHAGLPGIRPHTRHARQEKISLGSISIMQSLDSHSNHANTATSHVGKSIYNKRGWCFQERLLSSRSLIFGQEQVYWECQNAAWCEDSFWEAPEFPSIYRHSIGGLDTGFRLPLGSQHSSRAQFAPLYRLLAELYSKSILSFQRDQLNAFQGILHALETGFNESFYWAMPVSYLESALSWHDGPKMQRNSALHLQQRRDGKIVSVPFPSWSWIGWLGQNQISAKGSAWTADNNVLSFYIVDEYSNIRNLVSPMPEEACKKPLAHNPIPSWLDTTRSIITKDHIPEQVISTPLAATILCFWSSVCHGEIHFSPGEHVAVLQQGNLSVQISSVILLEIENNISEAADFVVVHRNLDDRVLMPQGLSRFPTELYILWLTLEAGVAYRRALFTVSEGEWEGLDTVWEPLILA